MSKSKITGKVLVIQLGRKETQIVLTDNDSHILHGVTLATPEGAVEDGMIWNPEAVQGMLKPVLKTPEFRGVRQAVFTLCTSQVITETITTPDRPMKELTRFLNTNMDMYFPVDIAEYQVVWQVIGPKNSNNGLKELLIQLWAVPHSILNRYYTVANSCGLSVAAIDYCGNSVATAVGASFSRNVKSTKERKKVNLNQEISFGKKKKAEPEEAEPEETAAEGGIVETDLHLLLDEDLLGLTFVQAGQVVFQRFIRCGSNPAYQLGELAMMVEYFQSLDVGRNAEINCIVSGGLASDSQLVVELADILGLPLSLLETPYDSKWFLCVGASRTSLEFGTPSLNKIVDTRKQMKSHLWQYGLVLAGALSVLAMVMMLLTSRLTWSTQLNTLQNESNTLMLQAAKISDYSENYYEYEAMYNAYSSDWEAIFSRLRTNNDNLVLMLQELEDMLPANVTVTSLEVTATGMNVSFACNNKEEAAYVIMKLRELEYAKPVYISDLKGGGRGAAKHYGSGEASETPPVEGSSVAAGDMATVNQEAFLETVVFLNDKVGDDRAFDTLKSSDYVVTPSSSHTLEELKEDGAGFTDRHAALEQMLKTNPFAMLRFKEFIMGEYYALMNPDDEDAPDVVLLNLILWDLLVYQDMLTTPPETLVDMYEFIDVLLGAINEEHRMDATEELLRQDSSMVAAYCHYLEVQMGKTTAVTYPYLNTDKISRDGGFFTGLEGVNNVLNALFPVSGDPTPDDPIPDDPTPDDPIPDDPTPDDPTPDDPTPDDPIPDDPTPDDPTPDDPTPDDPTPDDPTPEDPRPDDGNNTEWNYSDTVLQTMLNDYIFKGTSKNGTFDKNMDIFITYGGSGDTKFDDRIESHIENNKAMHSVLENLCLGYIRNVKTNHYVIDEMMNDFYTEGKVKNPVLSAQLAICSQRAYQKMVDDLLAKVEANSGNKQQTGTATQTVIDTRTHFAVVLEYKSDLVQAEQRRKNLDYSEKVAPLEVGD